MGVDAYDYGQVDDEATMAEAAQQLMQCQSRDQAIKLLKATPDLCASPSGGTAAALFLAFPRPQPATPKPIYWPRRDQWTRWRDALRAKECERLSPPWQQPSPAPSSTRRLIRFGLLCMSTSPVEPTKSERAVRSPGDTDIPFCRVHRDSSNHGT